MFKDKETPKEIQECRKYMARILSRRSLFVKYQVLEQPRRRYYFTSEDSSMAEAGDRVYSVVPFFNTGETKYWLSVSVEVTVGQNLNLKGVSLVVFEGEATSEMKTPAFRAEWDCADPLQTTKHAQPHWHVYSVIDKSVENMGSAFKPEPQVKKFKPKSLGTSRKFHFAMGSQWHKDKDSHTCQLDFDNLCKWLDGCVSYIRAQFDYLYSS
jgi:hypothetical protein